MAYRDGISDCSLNSGGGGGGGTSFLELPDELDDSSDPYFYFGWENVDGGWLIRRQERNTSVSLDATVLNNSSYANLAAAWIDRAVLVY